MRKKKNIEKKKTKNPHRHKTAARRSAKNRPIRYQVSVSCLLSDYELQRYGVLDSRKPSGDLQTRDKRRGSHKDRSAIGNGRNLWSKSENRGSRPGHGGPIAYKRPWSWTRNC